MSKPHSATSGLRSPGRRDNPSIQENYAMTLKTLRRIAGAIPTTALNPARSALILIDFQMEYFTGKLPLPDGQRAVANAAKLVDWADRSSIPVVHVGHAAPSPVSPLFPSGSERIAFHPLVTPKPRHQCITKTLPSSFVKTRLDAWLRANAIDTLLICGLMTHMCVESTARNALSLGYKVLVPGDACATRDLPAYDGRSVVGHQDLQRASLTALADRFAEVMDSNAILNLALAP